jgi:hypothetical protein
MYSHHVFDRRWTDWIFLVNDCAEPNGLDAIETFSTIQRQSLAAPASQ